MSTMIIRNARIASEDNPRLADADVMVEDGVIRAVASGLPAVSGIREIDANGRVLLPAMFDAHVHVREPGFEAKESIATGTEAAIQRMVRLLKKTSTAANTTRATNPPRDAVLSR